jgi:hypothetical protein
MPAKIAMIGLGVVIIIVVVVIALMYRPAPVPTTTTSINYASTSSMPISSTSTVPVQTYAFNLTNCSIQVSYLQQVDLLCYYNSSIDFGLPENADVTNITFSGPSGNLTNLYYNSPAAMLDSDVNALVLRMAPQYGTPVPGKYGVIVDYQGQKIFGKNFTFKGANVSVVGVALNDLTATSIPNDNHIGYKSDFTSIAVTSVNSGDLPSYAGITQAGITPGPQCVNNDNIDTAGYGYWMMPNTYSYANVPIFCSLFPTGSYTVNATLINYSDNYIIAASSFPVNIP